MHTVHLGVCTLSVPGERSSLRHALSTDTGIASRSTPSQYARSPESFTMSCVLGLYLATSDSLSCDVQMHACHTVIHRLTTQPKDTCMRLLALAHAL